MNPKAVIDAVFSILGIVLTWHSFGFVYSTVQRETLLRVHRGLPSLEHFTDQLIAPRSKAERDAHTFQHLHHLKKERQSVSFRIH